MRSFYVIGLILACSVASAQIVADHKIVDHYDDIPQVYMDSVKSMLVSIPGESHSEGYRNGQQLLERMDTAIKVETYVGTPPDVTNQYLRIGMHREGGEYLFFSESRMQELKGQIDHQNTSGNPFHVMGFGWCWDMTNGNDPGGIEDTVYQVRWAGRSDEGPDGSQRWGLDSGDSALTGNRVNMDSYLHGIESYIRHCADSAYPTKWIFTTGPVDMNEASENGFQREIKHDYIREYVAGDSSRILFDYADILCWSNNGEKNLVVWNDADSLRPHAQIHPDNMMDYNNAWVPIAHSEDGDHIGEVGALRLAKAMWWMLARIAGWDGEIPIRDLILDSPVDTTVMTGHELQLEVTILPDDATNKELLWSVIPESGTGSVSSQGIFRGGNPGQVMVIASATDNSGVADTLSLTILDPLVPVSNIEIETIGEVSSLNMGDSLQCTASVLPPDASNSSVIWSIVDQTGSALIGADGLVQGLLEGIVEVIATAEDGSQVADTIELSILDTMVYVNDIVISSAGAVSELISGDLIQFSADVMPENASMPELIWSVINGTGSASISPSGLLTAGNPGSVGVVASAVDGSSVSDTFFLMIIPPTVLADSIVISSAGGISILESGSTLQFTATIYPENVSSKTVVWDVSNESGTAEISEEGNLIAGNPGTVEVRAIAMDGSGTSASFALTILAPPIPITSIELSTEGGITELESGESLQFYAAILPGDASNQNLTWSIVSISGTASMDDQALLTAGNPGEVVVIAHARDGSGISDSLVLNILNPLVEVASIHISSAGNVSHIETGEMLQLYAEVNPSNASNPAVHWHVSNTNGNGTGSITQDGLFIALSEGKVNAVAVAQDGSGVFDSFGISVQGPSAEERYTADQFKIYPNPGRDLFYMNLGNLRAAGLRVLNVHGAVVLERAIEAGTRVLELDLGGLPAGIYYIYVNLDLSIKVKPIIIAR